MYWIFMTLLSISVLSVCAADREKKLTGNVVRFRRVKGKSVDDIKLPEGSTRELLRSYLDAPLDGFQEAQRQCEDLLSTLQGDDKHMFAAAYGNAQQKRAKRLLSTQDALMAELRDLARSDHYPKNERGALQQAALSQIRKVSGSFAAPPLSERCVTCCGLCSCKPRR